MAQNRRTNKLDRANTLVDQLDQSGLGIVFDRIRVCRLKRLERLSKPQIRTSFKGKGERFSQNGIRDVPAVHVVRCRSGSGPVVNLKDGLQHIVLTAHGIDLVLDSSCDRLVLRLVGRRHKLLMRGRVERSTKTHQQARKVRQRLCSLRRRVSPGKQHEPAERMHVDEHVYSMRVAKQVNIVCLRFGKRQAADKPLRTRAGIADGCGSDDAPHEVAIAIRIDAVASRPLIVAQVHSP